MPNSLSDLNDSSDAGIPYNDPRAYSITFSVDSPSTQNVNTNEDIVFNSPVGTNITALISTPRDITYTINVSGIVDPMYISWAAQALPPGVTFSNPSTNVFVLTGVNGVSVWNAYKSPELIAKDRATNFSYTATISYPNPANTVLTSTKAWTVNVTVTAQNEMSAATNFTYNEDSANNLLTGTPRITDGTDDGSTDFGDYNLAIQANTANALLYFYSTFDGGGNTSYDSSSRTLTINSNKTEVNNHLGNLYFTPRPNFDQNFLLTYTLINPISGLQTSITQQGNIANTNTDVSNVSGITRTYVTNNIDLLFPNTVPTINDTASGTYTITMTPSANIGFIGLGENFDSPANWNWATNTYTISGIRSEIQPVLANLRFFSNKGTTSNVTVTYTQSRTVGGATDTITQTFPLNCTGNVALLTGGNTAVTYSEDQSGNFATQANLVTINSLPHYSDAMSIELRSKSTGGTTLTDAVNFDAAGWSVIGNSTATAGVYKSFTRPLNVTQQLSRLSAIGTVNLSPRPDADFNFVVAQAISSDTHGPSGFDGTVLQTVELPVNVGNTSGEYSLTTTYSYSEDAAQTLAFSILDQDTTVTAYNLNIAQSSGTTGMFYVDNVSQGLGNAVVISASKSTINSKTVKFLPYADFTGTVGLTFTLTKDNYKGNSVVIANAIPITMTCGTTHTDYTLTTTVGYTEDTPVQLTFAVTDTDANASSFVSRFDQTSGNTGVFIVNGASQGPGNAAILANSKVNINAANVSFLPYPDYTGAVTIGYTQSKTNSVFGNVTTASNVAVNLTCTTPVADYSLTTAYTYAQSQNTAMVRAVTDNVVLNDTYTIRFDQTSGTDGVFFVDGTSQGIGNAATVSGSKSTVNAANITFIPAPQDISNVSIVFDQTRTTSYAGNIVQANAVPITLTCSTANVLPGYTLPASSTFGQNNYIDFGNIISDTDTLATSYTVTIQQMTGDPGKWYRGDSNEGASTSPLIVTGTKTYVNGIASPVPPTSYGSIRWYPQIDSLNAATFAISITKVNSVFGNYTLLPTTTISFTCSGASPKVQNLDNGSTRTYVANTTNSIFASNTPYIDDGDEPSNQGYVVSLSSSNGGFTTATTPTIAQLRSAGTITLTDSKANIASWFSTVKFVPASGFSSSGTFTYTQRRGGVDGSGNPHATTTRTVNLTCSSVNAFNTNYSFPYSGTASTKTYYWDPTPEEAYWGNTSVMVLTGGGQGSHTAGGGGGKVYTQVFNTTTAASSLTVVGGLGYVMTVGGTGGYGSSGDGWGSIMTGYVVSNSNNPNFNLSALALGNSSSTGGGQNGQGNTGGEGSLNVVTTTNTETVYAGGNSASAGGQTAGGGGASAAGIGGNASVNYALNVPNGGNGANGYSFFGTLYGPGGPGASNNAGMYPGTVGSGSYGQGGSASSGGGGLGGGGTIEIRIR